MKALRTNTSLHPNAATGRDDERTIGRLPIFTLDTMLFRTKVYVLLAVREQRSYLPDSDINWHDTVGYTLGINADDAAGAASIATRAAEHAVDRDGRYVGGVVLEVQLKCVGPEEFEGYERFLLQPLDASGIFYTSGITYTSIALHEAKGADKSLETVRKWIAENGIPEPSFVHPPLKTDDPKTVRIVCPVCQRWVEVDNSGLLYSFFDGLDPLSQEYEEGQHAVNIARPFIIKHFGCLEGRDEVDALIFLYKGDDRFDLLDDVMRD